MSLITGGSIHQVDVHEWFSDDSRGKQEIFMYLAALLCDNNKIYLAHRSAIKADSPFQRMPRENCRTAPSHQRPHVLCGAGA